MKVYVFNASVSVVLNFLFIHISQSRENTKTVRLYLFRKKLVKTTSIYDPCLINVLLFQLGTRIMRHDIGVRYVCLYTEHAISTATEAASILSTKYDAN